MHHKKVLVFLILSVLLAVVHYFAIVASLYWYYWWFDILMHLWGGVLVGFGVHVLATFKTIHVKASLKNVLFFLLLFTFTWEVFERFAGLFDPATYILDTTQDIILGFFGGLIAHFILSKGRIE